MVNASDLLSIIRLIGKPRRIDKLSDYEVISSSGIFDSAFYRSTYAGYIADGQDPLDHFLEIGVKRGYMASPQFDPALYRMLTRSCGSSDNPLLHYIRNPKTILPQIKDILPSYGHFSKRYVKWTTKDGRIIPRTGAGDSYGDAGDYNVFSLRAAREQKIPYKFNQFNYELLVPPYGFFFERFVSDRPFAFSRLPHGFWDALMVKKYIETEMDNDFRARKLSPAEKCSLAIRIAGAVHEYHGAFAETFIPEVLDRITALKGNNNIFRAVSFKGYPTPDEDWFPADLPQEKREEYLDLFSRYFQPDDLIYDATLWKRYLISGALKEFPSVCRDRYIILVASDIFSALDKRWGVRHFHHVKIPRALSQKKRWELLQEIKYAVADANTIHRDKAVRKPMVLFQCGGSLAFWFISHLLLFQQDVFYIDLGQALDGWFLDHPEIKPFPWRTIYEDAVKKNCCLESYYRKVSCGE